MPKLPRPPVIRQGLKEKAAGAHLMRGLWKEGFVSVDEYAQDQAPIQLFQGGYFDTFNAIRMSRQDLQSEPSQNESPRQVDLRPLLEEVVKRIHIWNELLESEISIRFHEIVHRSSDECYERSKALQPLGDTDSRDSASRIVRQVLDLDIESGGADLRMGVLRAEDTSFTAQQAEVLAPRLLEIAIQLRDSKDPEDKLVVWSAIRTGASMLRPNQADKLRPLLEPGHPIETSLVTVKMLGRIFEAQPPSTVDEHTALAEQIHQIANTLLNPYAVASSQSAATAQLAVYALAAMASTRLRQAIEAIRQLKQGWFSKQVARELRELREVWAAYVRPNLSEYQTLLDKAVRELIAN